MKKEQTKFIINILTIIFFIGSLVTALALIIYSMLIKGVSYQPILGLTKKEWYDTHLWMFITFAVLAIISFIPNFKNLIKQAKHVFKKKKD
nr:hypothetical protein [Nanoarchaeota archaeon]